MNLSSLGFVKSAKSYKDPIKVETKKRFLRPDKEVEVIEPEIDRSMKNTGFHKHRKNLNIEYASTDTLKSNVPGKYTVTHRYLGTNKYTKKPVSFKYKEYQLNESSAGSKSHASQVTGGSYNLKKNIKEIQAKHKPKTVSTWQSAKDYIGSWFK